MTWSAKFPILAVLCLTTVCLEAKPGEKGQFDIPIPVGHNASGIRLPSYDANGKLQMYFTVDKAFRIDDDHLKMANLRIETYDDTQTPQMMIDSSDSVLDLSTRILSSNKPVTVRRSDFEITGQAMTFDTNTREGKFTGHVHMLIFNEGDLQQSPKGATK